MRLALKLNAIEQEHLQELYDAAGVARDELPYGDKFEKFCQDFQDRTFKNAEPEQVYGALLKYVRSSTCTSSNPELAPMEDDEFKQLKTVLRRHARAGRVLPYSSEFDSALKEFSGLIGRELTPRDFWLAICRAQGRARRPPTRAAARAVHEADDSGDDDE